MSLVRTIDNHSRVSLLKRLLLKNKFLKIIEVHNGLSALIGSEAKVTLNNKTSLEFDGLWESSLTDSASKGLPDIEVVSVDSRLATINEILEVTNKPIIVDGDTGGDLSQFAYMVKKFERAGVSMVIIEDKIFPKRNSLEDGTRQELEKSSIFAEKIKRGLEVKMNPDFMIVARIESLIAGYGLRDALERAQVYLEAGADGIMIHSKSSNPSEILEFAKAFYEFPKKLIDGKPLICVPTTYNMVTDVELHQAGFHIVIHANHLLRSAYKAMNEVAEKILTHDRSFEADSDCATVKQIFKKVGFLDVKEKDAEVASKLKSKIKVIIPAAGANELAKKMNKPISLIEIKGKTVLQRQVETLAQCGLNNLTVIKGFGQDRFTLENINYYLNEAYETTHILNSLFLAEQEMDSPFIYINSDILFNESIINELISLDNEPDNDIILVVDSSYIYNKDRIHKGLDLVRTNRAALDDPVRQLGPNLNEEVAYVGKKISKELAHYEFIGIGYFSKRGGAILREVYHSSRKYKKGLQEADTFSRASFTDLLQEIVDRGYKVKALKTYKGWMEINSESDIAHAEQFCK